jgi:hypothetical protein
MSQKAVTKTAHQEANLIDMPDEGDGRKNCMYQWLNVFFLSVKNEMHEQGH